MKRFGIISALVLAAMIAVACRDDSYRGYEVLLERQREVRVAVGDPTIVRGSGPVDALASLDGKELFVWAFNRDMHDFRQGEDNLYCLIDGHAAILDGSSSLTTWKGDDAEYFYPDKEERTRRFDFFAAYLDLDEDVDLEDGGILEKTVDQVSYKTKLDGRRDIMLAKANMPLNDDGGIKDYAFSYISASEGDMPIFTLDHHLTRIDFNVQPGITMGEVEAIRVDSLYMDSHTNAEIVIASTDDSRLGINFDDVHEGLKLLNDDGTDIDPSLWNLVMISGDPTDEALKEIQKQQCRKYGGSIILSPQEDYLMTVFLSDMEKDTDDIYIPREPVPNTIRLRSGDGFLPGNRYLVTITIYSAHVIITHVQMIPWETSGTFVIDRDADYDLLDINLRADDLTLSPGSTGRLVPRIYISADGKLQEKEVPGVTFSFESFNPDVAAVDSDGTVHALATGTAWIGIDAVKGSASGHCVAKVTVN